MNVVLRKLIGKFCILQTDRLQIFSPSSPIV